MDRQCLGKAPCSQLLMPFLAELAAGLRRSSLIRAGEGWRDGTARCARRSSCQGADPGRGNPNPPSASIPPAGSVSGLRDRIPALRLLSLPSCSKCCFPGGTSGNLHREVCTAETSAGLAALARPCLRAASVRLAADTRSGQLPATGQHGKGRFGVF